MTDNPAIAYDPTQPSRYTSPENERVEISTSYHDLRADRILAAHLSAADIGTRCEVLINDKLTIVDVVTGVFHADGETRVRFQHAEPRDSFGPGFVVPGDAKVIRL